MVNLWPTIGKLQKLQAALGPRGGSLASQLEELAVFARTDLPDLILELTQQQVEDEQREEAEVAAALRAEQDRLRYEHTKSIEEESHVYHVQADQSREAHAS